MRISLREETLQDVKPYQSETRKDSRVHTVTFNDRIINLLELKQKPYTRDASSYYSFIRFFSKGINISPRISVQPNQLIEFIQTQGS